MNRYSNPGLRSKSDLLQETSKHFIQMITVAREWHKDVEVELFYNHIAFHCFRFREFVEYSRCRFPESKRNIIDDAMRHLSFLILGDAFEELQEHIESTEHRLRTLNTLWSKLQGQPEDIKARFAVEWLELEIPEDRRKELDNILGACADQLDKSINTPSRDRSKDIRITPKIDAHAGIILEAAQSLFDALFSKQSCSCTDTHGVGTNLALGTYQAFQGVTRERSTYKSLRAYKRKTLESDECLEELEFDMFMSIRNKFKEVQVLSTKEDLARSNLGREELPPSSRSSTSRKVESLCQSVTDAGFEPLHRLVLRLTGGRLFEWATEKSDLRMGNFVQSISLFQCLEEKHEFFTEKTQRILSLMLGYMVLHLNDTSWLKPGWSSTSILFLQTASRKTPLRPFIHLQTVVNNSSSNDKAFADLDSNHRCPALIALAVVLIELQLKMTFRRIAEMYDVQIMEAPHQRILLVDVKEVLNGNEYIELKGCRDEIPQDTPIMEAIDNCLDISLWEDDKRAPLDNKTLAARIYSHVVCLLEIHLTCGFKHIPLDGIDKYARNLDLERWCQSIDTEPKSGLPSLAIVSPPFGPPNVDQEKSYVIRVRASEDPIYQHGIHTPPSYPVISSSHTLTTAVQLETSRFFDDITNNGEAHIGSQRYKNWLSEYQKVYEKFIPENSPVVNPVKVAILDTGLDRDHEKIEAKETNLKGRCNLFSESQKSVPDRNGHGTFAASLILDYAPDVELYIIKIADKNALPNAEVIVKAIDHALEWNVDIISMSFGWPSCDFDGYDALQLAIDRAYNDKVLMFAAAANSGGRCGRAYPASSSQVICVHSTDTDGNRSSFSPTAEPNALNIATVGESILSAWPTLLCREGEHLQTRSATSYATPIVVGISAFLLHFARLHLSKREAVMLKRKEKMEALLKRCAERGPNYQPRDGYFYVELSLNRHNLFGQDLEGLRRDISKALHI